MRTLVFFVVSALACTAISATYQGSGQPGCKTHKELEIRIFRNIFDSTAYWKCENLNEPAVAVRCPDDTAFLDSVKDCVQWDDWKWEEPIAPLSEIDDE